MDRIIATSKSSGSSAIASSGSTITDWPVVGWLIRKGLLMTSLRTLTLLIFASAIITGLLFDDAKVGLATLLIWGVFWPLLTCIVTPTLGNLFCGICPHGFIGKWISKHGLNKPFPRHLRGVWGGLILIVLGYWIVTYAMPGYLSGSTRVTAVYFMIFTLAAFSVFFLFKDMAWCKHLCPLGRVLSTHSKIGILQITTEKNTCQSCKTFECAKACSYHLSPFRFEKRNNMESCTLCMDCVSACDQVQLVAKAPGKILSKPIIGQDHHEMWVFLIILGVAGIGIQFLHGLQHTPLKPYLPWLLAGEGLHALLPLDADHFDLGRFLALVTGLGSTMLIGIFGYRKAASLAQLEWKTTANCLAVALAPLAIIGLIPHAVTVFSTRTAHQLSNEAVSWLGLSWQMSPLANRGDTWLSVLSWLPYFAMIWTLWLVWQRAGLLVEQRILRIRVWFYGALPAFVFISIFLVKIIAVSLMPEINHLH